jgi:hypothetical protein
MNFLFDIFVCITSIYPVIQIIFMVIIFHYLKKIYKETLKTNNLIDNREKK